MIYTNSSLHGEDNSKVHKNGGNLSIESWLQVTRVDDLVNLHKQVIKCLNHNFLLVWPAMSSYKPRDATRQLYYNHSPIGQSKAAEIVAQ